MYNKLLLLSLLFPLLSACQPGKRPVSQVALSTQVLIVGGGAGGTAAALQSARLGARTTLVESTPWLGGMLSAAGVSAIDGNHQLPSGIWNEFRTAIRNHYGGADRVATGWVSHTLFEPHVADAVFKAMTAQEQNLDVRFGWHFVDVLKSGNRVTGAVFQSASGQNMTIRASIVIDATELGDVIAKSGAAFSTGMDARSDTSEAPAPERQYPYIQDLTWAAIVKDFGKNADKTIPKPANYDPKLYECCCADRCTQAVKTHPCETMLTYARLPNGKILLNWPIHGNDVYLNQIDQSPEQRTQSAQIAKDKTLGYLYYLQTELGYRHLGLADDEYPTADRLPFIPYHREGRRLKGLSRLTMNHMLSPFTQSDPLYRTGCSVGDYPLDHHHKEVPEAEQLEGEFPGIPSFSIPLGALVPESVEGLIAAEKAISVTHIANGATRLQPCVLLTGQAAGALAVLAVNNNLMPRQVNIRQVQQVLLDQKAFLMPYLDVLPDDPAWQPVQRVGATGLLSGVGIPFQWANQTWFYPDSVLLNRTLLTGLQNWQPGFYANVRLSPQPLTVESAAGMLYQLVQKEPLLRTEAARNALRDEAFLLTWIPERLGRPGLNPETVLTRKDMAVLLDALLAPFGRDIGWDGRFLR